MSTTPTLGVGHCVTCSTLSAKLWPQGAVEHCGPNCGNVGSAACGNYKKNGHSSPAVALAPRPPLARMRQCRPHAPANLPPTTVAHVCAPQAGHPRARLTTVTGCRRCAGALKQTHLCRLGVVVQICTRSSVIFVQRAGVCGAQKSGPGGCFLAGA